MFKACGCTEETCFLSTFDSSKFRVPVTRFGFLFFSERTMEDSSPLEVKSFFLEEKSSFERMSLIQLGGTKNAQIFVADYRVVTMFKDIIIKLVKVIVKYILIFVGVQVESSTVD